MPTNAVIKTLTDGTDLIAPRTNVSAITGSDGSTSLQSILDSKAQFPTQSGQSGKFLKTNGTSVSWDSVDALPSQTGQSGKFLTTNGTTARWDEATQIEESATAPTNPSVGDLWLDTSDPGSNPTWKGSSTSFGNVKLTDTLPDDPTDITQFPTADDGVGASPKFVGDSLLMISEYVLTPMGEAIGAAQTTANAAQTTASAAQTTASAAQTTANNAMPKSGGTFTGDVIVNNTNRGRGGGYVRNIEVKASDGTQVATDLICFMRS